MMHSLCVIRKIGSKSKSGTVFSISQRSQSLRFYCVKDIVKEPKLEEHANPPQEPIEPIEPIKPIEEKPLAKEANVFVKYLGLCMELSKARLGLLVAVTTAVGYLLGPGPVVFSQLALTSFGTSLAIASANTLNQYREVEFDEMMSRTANRVLPSGRMSRSGALTFALVTGASGTAVLFFFVNTWSALLAFSNIILYAIFYTTLKRIHWLNTWLGAVVGAVPPLIGWAANSGDVSLAGFTLFLYLFIWQIPHFLSLSWALKEDYNKANFKMLITQDQSKVAGATFRYSCYLLPISFLAHQTEFMTSYFAYASFALGLFVMVIPSSRFYEKQTSVNARKVFRMSLLYLPLLMLLMIFDKFVIQEYLMPKPPGEEELDGGSYSLLE